MRNIPYIIFQASGLGSRMGRLTNNKPKALVSLFSEPLLLRAMNAYPESFFIVLGNYQYEILKTYLEQFAPTGRWKLIKTHSAVSGSSTGIKEALKSIPEKTPFAVMWCDLYHETGIDLSDKKIQKEAYIGLSGNFRCRWRYTDKGLEEKRSVSKGVAGYFIFPRKDIICDVPLTGEFCEYLKKKIVSFTPFVLDGVLDVGTINKYFKATRSKPMTRPFNLLQIDEQSVTKIPVTDQGVVVAEHEVGWYKYFQRDKWNFLPDILDYSPLRMARVDGVPLHSVILTPDGKKEVLHKIIENLKTIHNSRPEKKGNFFDNNMEAYLEKTKIRLDSVKKLVPFINDKFITINGRRCRNYYQDWSRVEKLTKPFFVNTYQPIHGDCTFSNTLYSKDKGEVFLLDPRGYFGKEKIWGDPDYDWAKLFYSVKGNYDQFNQKNYLLKIDKSSVSLKVRSNGFTGYSSQFFRETGADKKKIEFLQGIIWLSLAAYCWDDFDSICGAFYKGILLLNEFEKKYGK